MGCYTTSCGDKNWGLFAVESLERDRKIQERKL